MELKPEEYMEQIYKGEIGNMMESLIAIEKRLTQLKLEKQAFGIKAIVVSLRIEELGLEDEKEKKKEEEKPDETEARAE